MYRPQLRFLVFCFILLCLAGIWWAPTQRVRAPLMVFARDGKRWQYARVPTLADAKVLDIVDCAQDYYLDTNLCSDPIDFEEQDALMIPESLTSTQTKVSERLFGCVVVFSHALPVEELGATCALFGIPKNAVVLRVNHRLGASLVDAGFVFTGGILVLIMCFAGLSRKDKQEGDTADDLKNSKQVQHND
jgi:hypothetical protein